MRSIVFAHPAIYSLATKLLYFDGLKILKKIIGKEKEVFEPACGYGRMKRYIHTSCDYSGIDLNERFIRFGRKRKRDIKLGNILDQENYRSCDVILLSDIFHHLTTGDIGKIFSMAVKFAREKIVIIEPEFVTLASRKNILSKGLAKIMSIMDSDGINDIKKWFSNEEYLYLFHKLKDAHEKDIQDISIMKFRRHFFVEMHIQGNGKPA